MRMLPGTELTKKQQPSLRSLVRDWREYNLEGQKPKEGRAWKRLHKKEGLVSPKRYQNGLVLSRYGHLGSQGRYCSSARPHRDGVGSVTARLPEGRVYSKIGGSREGVVGRHSITSQDMSHCQTDL